MKTLELFKYTTLLLATLSFLTVRQTDAAVVNLLTNGDFETGDLSGWSTFCDHGVGTTGSFFAHSTAVFTAPLSTQPLTMNVAGNGTTYALSDTDGPAAKALIQTFTVPLGANQLDLSFDMFVNNWHSNNFQDSGLDYTVNAANHHARVDILTSTASPFSTAAADIAHTVLPPFADVGGAFDPYDFTSYGPINLLPFLTPGTTYQLRFADVRNKNNPDVKQAVNSGVDNVVLAVPEPSSIAIFGIGAVGMLFGAHRRRRKKQLEEAQE